MSESEHDTIKAGDGPLRVGRCLTGFPGGSVHEATDFDGQLLLIINQVSNCSRTPNHEKPQDESMLIYRFKSLAERDRFIQERWPEARSRGVT